LSNKGASSRFFNSVGPDMPKTPHGAPKSETQIAGCSMYTACNQLVNETLTAIGDAKPTCCRQALVLDSAAG
jgi:hypothetical protein